MPHPSRPGMSHCSRLYPLPVITTTGIQGIAGDLLKAHPDAPYADELASDVSAAQKAYQQAADAYG